MAYKQYVITLTDVAQNLATVVGITTSPAPSLRHVSLQPGAANAAPVYLGDVDVSATAYAVRLAAASEGVPPAPYIMEGYDTGPFRLSDFYVIGTAAQKLHIGVVEF